MAGPRSRIPLLIGVAVAVIVVVGLALRWRLSTLERPDAAPPDQQAAVPAPVGLDAGDPAVPGGGPGDDLFGRDPRGDPDDRARAWAQVDMEEIRKAMPDNLYWKMAAPTSDPEVLRARDEERDRWNVAYGKVLSNTATAEEVDAYYAYRQQVSTDYLEFLIYLRDHYAAVIPAGDVGALKLAAELHLARLEEIPRQQAEAHERRKAHEAARAAWLADQKAFEQDTGADASDDAD